MRRKLPLSSHLARIVLALAVIFSLAAMIGFAFTPPAGPWWWTGAFLDGKLGLLTIWAALGPSPWYVRWPCCYAALELTTLHVRNWDAWSTHRHEVRLPHVLLTFVVLFLLRELSLRRLQTHSQSGRRAAIGQLSLRTMFACIAAAALALWIWKHRAELRPWRWVTDFPFLVRCAALTALDLVAVRTLLHYRLIHWRLLWLAVVALVAQLGVWHFSGEREWWNHLPRMCLYDVFYLSPIIGGLAAYRWARTLAIRTAGLTVDSSVPNRFHWPRSGQRRP